MATQKKKTVKTTGHEWDGIKEYNNPLPRWWVWVFIITIIYSVGYAFVYPTWPGSAGAAKESKEGEAWSQYSQLDDELKAAKAAQQVYNDKIAVMSAEQIVNDPALKTFAVAAGKAQFALSCSQCHGAGGAGASGYPNLLDDEWLWGGKLDDIIYTITHGIRSFDDDETRDNTMMAYGDDEMLSKEEIDDVVRFVKVLSKQAKPTASSERGAVIFAENCASCHGEKGEGMHEMGAPALNNRIWLYGGDGETLLKTVTSGRAGHMPAFSAKLDENEIKKLAVYVQSLSGGE